jgi:hypothetical protein
MVPQNEKAGRKLRVGRWADNADRGSIVRPDHTLRQSPSSYTIQAVAKMLHKFLDLMDRRLDVVLIKFRDDYVLCRR